MFTSSVIFKFSRGSREQQGIDASVNDDIILNVS